MAEAFLQVLIENLSSLIQREIGLVMGVDKEMKKLSSTLTTIQAVLEDAEDKQFQSKPIQNWLIKLNDIAYEIEDILDECTTEVSKMKHKRSKFNLKKILFSRKIGRRMKGVAEKLDAVAAEHYKFHLRELVVPQSSQGGRRETGSIISEPDHIYGRDEDKEKIVDILVNQVADCQQLSVLPIIGVGGLGKTTLAQLVYKDKRVSQHFDTKLWVCVSDNFDLKILLEAMIVSATGSASNLVHLDALQCRLQEVLNQARYLLVLDDVWNEDQEDWVKLKSILACGKEGASVIVTTRLTKVADIMATLPAYCLKGLPEKHCWLLFRLRAFGQENEEHPNLKTIGREIVKKCAGVPLAAKALGGLLRFKRNEREWIHVRESEIWKFPEDENAILPVLRLSYHHLPLELRQCFVYCAVFPKNSEIEKNDLIFRWMAHGCISSNGMLELEDVGDQIWNELVLRSFFQEVKTTKRETTFKMHDLVHDLAQSIMENKLPGAQMKSNSVRTSNSKIREVYLGEFSKISPSGITLQVSTLTTIMNYSCLRILILKGARLEKLPSGIGKLKHLRYLNMTGSSIHILPRTICDLWNLQVLILNYCHSLKSLPKDIRHMANLRHIFLERCYGLSYMPPKIGELTSLKTLSLFVVGHETGSQLDELELLNLRGTLEIRHLERIQNHMNVKKVNLVMKPNLHDLVLSWKDDGTSESAKMMDEKVLESLEPHPNLETLKIHGFKGWYFPLWMTKMENVTVITLENCPNCSRLPPLGDLPRLKTLCLINLDALEHIVEGETSIQAKLLSLEELRLCHLPNLKGLLKGGVGELIFPNLQSLSIKDCQLLKLPTLSTLKKLEALKCSLLTLSSFSKLENLSSLWLGFDEDNKICIPADALEGLCNLKELRVMDVREHHLPEQWFQGLKSLAVLRIHSCNIRSCFPEGWLGHLTALEELIIWNCKELIEVPEEIKYLHLLRVLRLSNIDDMVSLPQGLQHIPSLQYLRLNKLPQLTSLSDWPGNLTSLQYLTHVSLPQLISLPDWLGNLTSLRDLTINSCPAILSLPSSIQGMTNLKFLRIWDCPQLKRRCQKEKGEDWHKIAHIPHLNI